MSEKTYKTLEEFYPYYLSEHRNRTSRVLHFIGTGLALVLLALFLLRWQWVYLLLAVVSGYAFAWMGHFFFERNRPATFTYPVLSLISDFRLFFEILTRRRGFRAES
ncbi:MAG TPA: DUF962 domain-containing protein [bacterium]|nr:DUF962 domain-containing protein [bacterium]